MSEYPINQIFLSGVDMKMFIFFVLFSTNLCASEFELFCNHPDSDIAYTAHQIAKSLAVAKCSKVEPQDILSLNLEGADIVNLMPLKLFTNLLILNLSFNSIKDLTPLEELQQLTNLNLAENMDLENLAPLASLIKLNILNLNDNNISDLNPLKDMIKLVYLSFLRNQVEDISPLKNLFALKTFLPFSNPIIFDQQHCPTGIDIAPIIDRFCRQL